MRSRGVGWQSAIRLVLELGDIERFRTTDALPHYLGLTPSQYSSGELDHRGHTLKCGPGFLRALLLQCAWSAVRQGCDTELKERFAQLAPRIGRKRAIVAVARRLAIKLRGRWRNHLLPGEPTPRWRCSRQDSPSTPADTGTRSSTPCAVPLGPPLLNAAGGRFRVWQESIIAKHWLRPRITTWWVSLRGAHEWQNGPLQPVRRSTRTRSRPRRLTRGSAPLPPSVQRAQSPRPHHLNGRL